MKEEKNSEGEQVMRSELASIRELLELEPDSKCNNYFLSFFFSITIITHYLIQGHFLQLHLFYMYWENMMNQ